MTDLSRVALDIRGASAQEEDQDMTKTIESSRPTIAVVGVSALFPGSLSATGFWKDILEGRDLITDVPSSHWLIEDFYDPDPSVPDKTYAKRGAFLKDIDFDALGWGIPPNLIPETDTSQLLALIVAQKVLEDACGQSSEALENLDRDKISVILGVTSGQELLGSMVSRLQRPVWVKALRDSGLPEDEVQDVCDRISAQYTPWRESTFPGLLGNVVAGRIANRLDLGGTNCVTDAACASTFSALSMGVNELYLGDSDMVIVGGVDTMNDIFMFMCFSKTPALSATGDCRPFSDQADGTMLSEGLGMVALKRLEDAERDGDRIYAVINAVGSSSDGRAKSVYAPVPEGQAKALRRAYGQLDFGPEQVELVEAHGTGTKAGDAAEFKGLATAFAETGRQDAQWCALGSVKSQIGHAKAAAGAAGLFKAIMALHHKVLPPTIKVERPNPTLEIETSPFHLSTEARPWVRDTRFPRRASVSSFGFGGSNFHVAMSEYVPPEGSLSRPAPRLRALSCELVTLSADSGAELVRKARACAEDASKSDSLQWLAHESQREFDASTSARLAIVATDESDLKEKLEQAATMIEGDETKSFETPTGIHYVNVPAADLPTSPGGLAYLFSGQGSQYLHMGASVAMQFGDALAVWDRAANFEWDEDKRLHQVVFPRTAFEDEEREEQQRNLSATEWAQPAIGCTSLSLLRLLDRLGLEAESVAGHSFGEITALHAAGILSEENFLEVARRRGELMAQAAVNPGAMIAVAKPIEEVRKLLEGWDTPVVIANHNAPEQVVLSGETSEIESIEEKLAEQGMTTRRLPVATAFHSPVVEKASGTFGEFLTGVEFSAPNIPVYSNTTGKVHDTAPEALREMIGKQLAREVKFVDMIEAMYSDGIRTFVEVGPGSVLTRLVGTILGDREHVAISLDRKGKEGVRSFFEALAKLSTAGHALDFTSLWKDYAEPENPNDRIEPKLKISINGTNYGKPYPPEGGAAALPLPNPPREKEIETVSVEKSGPSPEAMSTSPSAAPAAVLGAIPVQQQVVAPAMAPAAQVAPVVQVAPVAQVAQVAPVAQQPVMSAGWAMAYQEAQRQTAEAHVAYMQAMAQTHTAYLDTIDRSFQSLSAQAGLQPAIPSLLATPVVPAITLPQPQIQAPPPMPLAPVASPAPVAPVAQLAPMVPIASPVAAPVAAAPVVAQPPVAVQPVAPAPAAVAPPAPALAVAPEPELAVVPPPPPSGMNGGGVDLHALLLEVVSDKTGYPTEMLTLEMELEADLGIDSIKRVEILSTMNDLAPGLPEVDMAVMAKLATLGQVVDYMVQQLGEEASPAPAMAASASEVAHADDEPPGSPDLGRYVLDAVEQPAIGMAQSGLFGAGPMLVIDGGSGLAESVATELESRGVEARVATEIPAGDLRGVILLAGLRDVADEVDATRVNREVFEITRAVAARFGDAEERTGDLAKNSPRPAAAGVFVSVHDTGGAFGTGPFDPKRAWLAGCAGLARTVAQEWPGISVKAIDLERGGRSAVQIAVAITDELMAGGPDLDVGLSASGRRVVLRSREATVVRGTGVLHEGDVVVASGGARGVTATTLIALAGQASLRFVLLGRTRLEDEPACCRGIDEDVKLKRELLAQAVARGEKLTPVELGKQVGQVVANREIRATLAAIERAGSSARYETVDVTSLESVSTALSRVRAEWGEIKAIVHGAGVIADKRVSEKTPEQFDRVFDTKVEGLRSLLAATASDPIALLCLFSSVAARCGNVGQVDYAMANEVLNKVAVAEARRRGGQCLVKSLGWGPWEGGMVSPQLKAHFEAMGVPLIPLRVGAKMLIDELTDSAPSQVELVLGGEPKPEALLSDSESPGRSFTVDVAIGQATHPYLVDHAIKGTPVVPVALVIEWFTRTARAFGPELQLLRLSNLKVLRGISLQEFSKSPRHFVVHCQQLTNGSGATLSLELLDDRGGIYYRCDAELAEERGTPQPQQAQGDLELAAWGDAAVYDGELLFHGPAFQMIRQIEGISSKGMVADLSGVVGSSLADKDLHDVWETDPLAIDGGLQLALLWCKHVLGGASLPTGIEEIRCWAGVPSSTTKQDVIRCTLTGRVAKGSKSLSDLVFHDAAGNLLAELVGVETHLLPSQGKA